MAFFTRSAARRSDRHAQLAVLAGTTPQLQPPLAHGVAHHTVDADGGQCQSEYRKDSYQYRREEARRQGIRKQSIHGHNVSHRQASVGSVDDVCCCGRHRGWVGRCTDDEIWCPSSREVDVERGLALQFELVYVAYNSDDRAPARFFIERTDIDALAERITAGPESPRHRIVDQDVRELPVLRVDKTAGTQRDLQRCKIAEAAGANFRKRTSARDERPLPFDYEPARLPQLRAPG